LALDIGERVGGKLTVFMLDGTATGPKTIEIDNWSGIAIFSPRALLKGLLRKTGAIVEQLADLTVVYDGEQILINIDSRQAERRGIPT
jgi:hypothetical protein